MKSIQPAKFCFLVAMFLLPCSWVSAQSNISQLLQSLKKTAEDSTAVELYWKITRYYQYSHPDSASYYLQQGIDRFTKHNYKKGIASLINIQGTQEASHGNMDAATRKQNEALKMFEELNNKRGIALAHNALGTIEGRRGNFDIATKHFILALKAYEDISYSDGLVSTYINLGNINGSNDNFEKALEYDNKALSLITDTNEVSNRCNLYNNIAILYGKKGDLKRSLEYLQKALAKSNKEEYIDIYVYSLLNMGIVYSKFGDFQKARTYLEEALKIAREKSMTEEYARILVNIASITSETDSKKAIAQLEEALIIAKQLGNKSMLEDIYYGLAELNKKTGNYKYVVTVLEELHKYEDSTSSVEKSKEIANLQSVYELEQSNNKIAQLKLKEQANIFNRNILYTVVICLAVFIIFILVYLNKTRQLNALLSRQEAELKSANSIKDRLFSIIGHDLRSPMGNMSMILDLLEERSRNTEDEDILRSLKDQAVASLETLDKLLHWGKLQISGQKLVVSDFAACDYIDKSIGLLKINAKQKDITVTNNTASGTTINGDSSHFDFIIRNLLSNAIKFTRNSGRVEIGADSERQPGYVVFYVRDNGIGIKNEKLTHLFEAFESNTAGTADETGTGIGLMLSKEFVTENKGRIWVESTAGTGTTFYFSFKKA